MNRILMFFCKYYIYALSIGLIANCHNTETSPLYEKTRGLETTMICYELDQLPTDSQEGLWTSIGLGMNYYYAGEYFLADSCIKRDLALIEKYGLEFEEDRAYGGTRAIDNLLLGLISMKQKKFTLSLMYLYKAETEFMKIEYESGIVRCCYTRAQNYIMQEDDSTALKELGDALEIAEPSYEQHKYAVTEYLILNIKKEIGRLLEKTKGEFQGKNHLDWYKEAIDMSMY